MAFEDIKGLNCEEDVKFEQIDINISQTINILNNKGYYTPKVVEESKIVDEFNTSKDDEVMGVLEILPDGFGLKYLNISQNPLLLWVRSISFLYILVPQNRINVNDFEEI